jgi:hypothetical protein
MGGRYHVHKDGASSFPRGGPDRVLRAFLAENVLFHAAAKQRRNGRFRPVTWTRSVHARWEGSFRTSRNAERCAPSTTYVRAGRGHRQFIQSRPHTSYGSLLSLRGDATVDRGFSVLLVSNGRRGGSFVCKGEGANMKQILLVGVCALLGATGCAVSFNDSAPATPGSRYVAGSKANVPTMFMCPEKPGTECEVVEIVEK